MRRQEAKTKAGEHITTSSGCRENSLRRNKKFNQYNGNIRRKANACPIRKSGFPALNISVKPKRITIQASSRYGYVNIPNERTQVNLIRDIYPILKKHSQFKDHEKQWNEKTKTWDVMNWITGTLNRIVGSNWLITSNGENENYYIVTYYEHDNDMNWYCVPLSFLPSLKEKNKKLHDMVVALVSLIQKHTGVDKWDAGYGDFSVQSMMEEWEYQRDESDIDDEEKEKFKRAIYAYTKGYPAKYTKSINNCRVTKNQLKNMAERFKPLDKIEEKFLQWIDEGIKLMDIQGNIYEYNFNPADPLELDEKPLTPENYICFIWDYDKVFDYHDSYVQSDYENGGVIPFCQFQIWQKTDRQIQEIQPSIFPKKIISFFNNGTELINEFEKI